MRKILLASTVILLVAAGGAGWYILEHRDPLQQAKALIAKGDYRAASLQLRSAVRDNPDSAEAHALFAQILLVSDDPIAAEHEINQAIALHWDPTVAMATLSQAYMRQSKWKDILDKVPTSAATPEQTAYYLMVRAVAQRGLNDVPAANETLATAERLAPQSADVHLTAARFALTDGHQDQALNEVDRSLALEPDRTDALQFKANLLAMRNDRDGSLAALTKAIAGAPNRSDLLLQRAALLLIGNQDDKVAADIDAVLSRDPKNVPGQYIKAILLIRKGKFADADVLLQGIDQYVNQLQRGLYFKALVKAQLGQNAQAEDAIIAFVNRTPGDADALRLLATIELNTQHADRAVPYLQRAVQNGQRDSETLNLLARTLAATGKQREAESVLQQASEQANKPGELTRLASARLQMGDLSGAQTDLQHSLEMSPQQPGAGEALVTTALRLGQLDRAQQALDDLRKRAGNTEAVGNLSGLIKLARLDPEGALADFADTAARFPDSVAAPINQARVLLQLRRVNDALPVLAKVLEKTPAQADALSLYAQTLLVLGRNADAIDAAERARKADPTNLGLINGEAQLYARLQQYDKALAVLETARVGGSMPTALLATLAGVQVASGQTDAAKRTLADLVAADPNNIAAVLADFDLLLRLKDFNGARQVAGDALQRHPDNFLLMQTRVRADFLEKGIDAALQTADQLRANPAYMPSAALLKGSLYIAVQRYKDAVATFQSEFDREPTSPLASALAEAMNLNGDLNGALGVMQRWQSTHPDDANTAQTYGMIDIAAKRYEDAERNLQIVLKSQPNSLIALNNLAWIYQQKGDKRAREYAQRAYEQSPTPEVMDTFGWILVTQGEANKALPILQNAASARPQNGAILYHLAVALKDNNRPDEAVTVLRPLVDGPLTFDEKSDAQALLTQLSKPKP